MKRHGLVFTLSALSLALTACSGGSSTINENPSLTDGVTVSPCTDQDNCVSFEFTDEPVVNLNYRCGVVVDVTDQTGVGKCMNGTKAEFFLRAKGGKKEILLGSAVIRGIRTPTSSEKVADAPIVRITPIDLAASNANNAKIENIDSAQAIQAVQITRLLQAVRDENRPYIDGEPVNLLIIDHDKIKKHIDQLPTDIKLNEYNTSDKVAKLEEALAPFLVAAGIQQRLPDEATAKARLELTLHAIQAGAYYGTPTITLPVINDNDVIDDEDIINLFEADKLKLGIEGQGQGGTGVNRRATMALYMLKDRDGYSIGQGMYWSGVATDPKQAYELYRNNNFEPMSLINDQAGFNRFTGKVENMVWKTSAGTDTQTQISFDEGTLIGNVVMAGGDRTYRNIVSTLADTDPIPALALGTWKQYKIGNAGEVESSPIFTGSATISKSSSVNTFLDPAVWRTQKTVATGDTYVFPLHVTFTLRGISDCSLGVCPVIGEFSATILANGNIISDLDSDCSAVDVDNHEVSAPSGETVLQEQRIGVVRAAYTDTEQNNFFIGPSIMLAGTPFKSLKNVNDPTKPYNLDGIQIGTLAIAPRVKMNVAGVRNAAVGTTGSVNITDSSSADSITDGVTPARWVNVYSSYYKLITNPTPDQSSSAKNFTGTLSVRPTSCYTVKRK